jgi:phospholipid/cholesterol/gamma-HCH transport system substrate-binding protein
MTKSRHDWKVGLFVLVALVLAGALVIQFSKGLTLLRSTYDIYLDAPDVGGLQKNAGVMMSGVQIGRVVDIRLNPGGKSVTLTLRIYGEFQVHRDAQFVIDQSGFLGDTFVAVVPTANTAPLFVHQDPVHAKAEEPFNLQAFTRSASGFLTRTDETVRKLNEILDNLTRVALTPRTLTNVAMSLENLRGFSEQALAAAQDLRQLVATNSPTLTASSTNLALFSERLSRFAGNLDSLLATNAPDVNTAIDNFEQSSLALKKLLDEVHAGRGLAGNLLKNEQIANDIAQLSRNLSITSSNLNQLGLWGILWKRKPTRSESVPPPPVKSPKDVTR